MKNNPPPGKIENVLHSLNGLQPAVPSPVLYAQVMARIALRKNSFWDKWTAIFLRPSIAFCAICLIVVMNFLVLYTKFERPPTAKNTVELASSEEYRESLIALYDLENGKP